MHLHDYKIDYTFGVYPLQQYLIAFPGGRWQALSLAWDSPPAGQGGQRWFHLYPDEKVDARRRAALDRDQPELELHVRRLPLDQPAQGYDLDDRQYAHDLVGDRRVVRGLPRPGFGPCRVGEAERRRDGPDDRA